MSSEVRLLQRSYARLRHLQVDPLTSLIEPFLAGVTPKGCFEPPPPPEGSQPPAAH